MQSLITIQPFLLGLLLIAHFSMTCCCGCSTAVSPLCDGLQLDIHKLPCNEALSQQQLYDFLCKGYTIVKNVSLKSNRHSHFF